MTNQLVTAGPMSIPSKEVDDASQLKLFPSQELPRLGSRSIRKASPSNIKYQMNRNKNGPKPAMAGPRSPDHNAREGSCKNTGGANKLLLEQLLSLNR